MLLARLRLASLRATRWVRTWSLCGFDEATAIELQRPAAVFQMHGLIFDAAAVNQPVNNQHDFCTSTGNVAGIARCLQKQAQERQLNMPRLYTEFITAYLARRQQLETVFVQSRVALREGRVPNAAWMLAMQIMTRKTPSSEIYQDGLDIMIVRAGLPLNHRRDKPPIFIPSRFRARVNTIYGQVLKYLRNPVMSSDWARATIHNNETPDPLTTISRKMANSVTRTTVGFGKHHLRP
ncbi:hypothetical protein NPX13_g747 [Xylaria arbuscula]|uniref:Uncharacterized protein n=1 Tax=Xylaria arbuscula TaxID=114810 RepID=A0A9W8NNZ2_9PEZI|nr:hypothetical protein NPX13_g747 [Xylaria arbuscula]